MNGVFVDSRILLDLFTDDPVWAGWSESVLEQYAQTNSLYINSIVYTEISIGFERIEDVDAAVAALNLRMLEIPREALFLAGKTFLEYRRNRGIKSSLLPDFFIGAHASVSRFDLITRDTSKYQTYFPRIRLIHPDKI